MGSFQDKEEETIEPQNNKDDMENKHSQDHNGSPDSHEKSQKAEETKQEEKQPEGQESREAVSSSVEEASAQERNGGETAVEKTEERIEKEAGAKREESGKDKPREQERRGPGRQQKRTERRPAVPEEPPEFIEKVIKINRVTKVTKGGKKLSFSALVVVGNMKGRVGFALAKAPEVADAIRKALTLAKKYMVDIPLRGTTITHEIIGEWCGAEVLLKPASEGTGVIASGPVRAVCEAAGIHNILTKCHRSNNPVNVIKATMHGLTHLKSGELQPAE